MNTKKLITIICFMASLSACSQTNSNATKNTQTMNNNIEKQSLPADSITKPVITISNDWKINGLEIWKAAETDFINSGLSKNLERVAVRMPDADFKTTVAVEIDYSDAGRKSGSYSYFSFAVNENDRKNPQKNILKGYCILDFKRFEISFENGIIPFSTREDIIKILGKNQMDDYDEWEYADLKIKNDSFDIVLLFDNKKFWGITILKKGEKFIAN